MHRSGHQYFTDFYAANTAFARELMRDGDSVVVEFGCGTGEFLDSMLGYAHRLIGIDNNQGFLDKYTSALPSQYHQHVSLLCGDMQQSVELLAALDTERYPRAKPLVAACVGNTLGVIPEDADVLRQVVLVDALRSYVSPDAVCCICRSRQTLLESVRCDLFCGWSCGVLSAD